MFMLVRSFFAPPGAPQAHPGASRSPRSPRSQFTVVDATSFEVRNELAVAEAIRAVDASRPARFAVATSPRPVATISPAGAAPDSGSLVVLERPTATAGARSLLDRMGVQRAMVAYVQLLRSIQLLLSIGVVHGNICSACLAMDQWGEPVLGGFTRPIHLPSARVLGEAYYEQVLSASAPERSRSSGPPELQLLSFMLQHRARTLAQHEVERIGDQVCSARVPGTIPLPEQCRAALSAYAGKSRPQVVRDVEAHCHTWDAFALACTFLELGAAKDAPWPPRFLALLRASAHPVPFDRPSVEDAIAWGVRCLAQTAAETVLVRDGTCCA